MSLRNNVLVRRYKNFRNPSNAKTVIGSLLAFLAFFGILAIDPSIYGMPELSLVEQRVVAIFLTATILWITEAIPTWCTSVLIIVVMLLTCSDSSLWFFEVASKTDPEDVQKALGLGISYKDIMACFADPTVMLFMGGFVLAIGVEKVGLDVAMAKAMLAPFGTRPAFVLMGFILVTALFSAFISNTATAAMMLAFLAPVLRSMPNNGSKGKIALAMAIPLGANIGGIATPIGTPPNGVAQKYLNDPDTIEKLTAMGLPSSEIDFLDWCVAMTPITIIILAIGWVALMLLFPFKKGERIEIKIEGSMKKGYKTLVVGLTFLLTVILWITGKWNGINSYVVALIPICCLCLTGLLSKKDLEKINWSVLWMVAGGFALGLGFSKSGLATDLVTAIPFNQWSPIVVLIVAGLVCWTLSNFISNSATAALLIPILCAVGIGMGPTLMEIGGLNTLLFGTAMAASLAMTLPISTPPNAIASSTGIISTYDMAKAGLIIGVVGGIIGYLLLIYVF